MSDDVVESGGTITFRQALHKRVITAIAGVAFAALGAFLAFGPMEGTDNPLLLRIIGYACIAFAGYGVYATFTKPRTVLVASREGLLPAYLAPHLRTLIPWSNIVRFDEVILDSSKNKTRFLAVYLKEPQQLEAPMDEAFRPMFARMMSDGGTANLYIPEILLPESVAKTLPQLERARAMFSSGS